MTQWVYTFGDGRAEGQAGMKNLLGGKGANLAEMSNLGLPVPPGFTITTEVCTYYYDHGSTYPDELKAQVENALSYVPAAPSATPQTRSSCPSAPAPAPPCPA
jgi:pyruvate,orthophosphate dikinase